MTTNEQIRLLEENLKMQHNIELRDEFIENLVDRYFGIGWQHRATPQKRAATTSRTLGAITGKISDLRGRLNRYNGTDYSEQA